MPNDIPSFDIAIIGGGIVGLATALNLMDRRPDCRLAIVEKESELAFHQTGHNSGVLHTGIYYKPGSLKAINCREGKKAMEAFCEQNAIPFRRCGKVIVATAKAELPKLHEIFARGQANGVTCRLITGEECREIEPHAQAIAAIHVPEAGIINYKEVCQTMARLMLDAGHQILLNRRVTSIRRDGTASILQTPQGDLRAATLINCAGLHCDRVTHMTGIMPSAKIIPFRGEYFKLRPSAEHLCKTLIYPVPDPAFPFLGVHFTSMIQGGVECGPNAVLALGREAYGKYQIHPHDLFESLTYRGFQKMAIRHWRMGLGEMWRSYSKRAFVHALQRLLPEIQLADLEACPSGIRAQAVTDQGALVDDFLIDAAPGVININNAPSPAATASLSIGRLIAQKVIDAHT